MKKESKEYQAFISKYGNLKVVFVSIVNGNTVTMINIEHKFHIKGDIHRRRTVLNKITVSDLYDSLDSEGLIVWHVGDCIFEYEDVRKFIKNEPKHINVFKKLLMLFSK